MAKPTALDIRAYNIGFGDCFLLTFRYGAKDQRHMLIDFGTTRKPDDAEKDHELQIAKDIAGVTSNKLDVVVATHRHKVTSAVSGPGRSRATTRSRAT